MNLLQAAGKTITLFYMMLFILLLSLSFATWAQPADFNIEQSNLTIPELEIISADCGNYAATLHLDFEHNTFAIIQLNKTPDLRTHFSPWPPDFCLLIPEAAQ